MRRRLPALVVLIGVLGAALPGAALAKAGPLPSADLQSVRAAVAKYHSLKQAEAAGYSLAGQPCVDSPFGAMGFHAVNMRLLADLAVDPLEPEILLYAPKASGGYRLVGVEYWMIALANTESGPAPWLGTEPPPLGFFNAAPSLFGQPFDGPMEGHEPGMPWHYDLHVWVFEHNPAGVFAMFNPALSC